MLVASENSVIAKEFEEIGHTGGTVTFHVTTAPDGRRRFQVQIQHQRPTAAAWFAAYAISPGLVVAPLPMGGIGSPWPPPPMPGCIPVFVASDSEGMFGHKCPACGNYWRARFSSLICPYCGLHGNMQDFLTDAQNRYVQHYCAVLENALASDQDGAHVIDMDAVADAVGKDAEKPPFYYSEERQQHNFKCAACDQSTDILGRYGYCSVCGTRNDLVEFEKDIAGLRDRINAGASYESCCKDAVSAFDSFVAQYAKQLVRLIPMTTSRISRIERMGFHNLGNVSAEFKEIFDIDVLAGLSGADVNFAKLMFHRRHVYEHNGGEADAKYIADSGDTSVREKQMLRETQEAAHRIAGLVQRMATNLHRGFHEIFPPVPEPIERHARHQKIIEQHMT